MRAKFGEKLEWGRVRSGEYGSSPGDRFGAFRLKLALGCPWFVVIASDGDENLGCFWEHVSVSTAVRCPTWDEMCRVKDLFWGPDEWVVQFHPPVSENISNHRYCLHLWRPTRDELPTPPSWTVGVKEIGEIASPEKAAEARLRASAIKPATR